MDDIGYPLDLTTPVRHVATEMGRVAPAALSIKEMAATYRHPNPSDLSRVRAQEDCASDDEAVEWLLARAIKAITRRGKAGEIQVEQNGSGYHLADGVSFDDLIYNRKKINRIRDDHAYLRDAFNPMSGDFSENIRSFSDKDLDELRESMREFGWIEHFPAIKDERGVVLVGHRRLRAAKLEDIEPRTVTVRLGDGDEADARRFRLAIASNLGGKPLTPTDRKKIAKYLYGDGEGWSQQRIAGALNVTQKTISKDLGGYTEGITSRSRGGHPHKLTDEQTQQVIEDYHEFGGGKTMKEIAEDLGYEGTKAISPGPVVKVIDQERGRREERALRDAGQCKCPNCGNVHGSP